MVQRSVSASGYIPRAPTGSERSRLNKGDNDSMGITEMLKDLDKQAGYVREYLFMHKDC